jgi:hypothetical protein
MSTKGIDISHHGARLEKFARQLAQMEIRDLMQAMGHTDLRNPKPFETTATLLAKLRSLRLNNAAVAMLPSSAPCYASTPEPIKLILESLLDPEKRQRLLDLIEADEDENGTDEWTFSVERQA